MKVLIYTASSLCNPQFGIQMELAIKYAEEGNEVVFCHCDGLMSACSANLLKNKAICRACKIGFRAGIKNLPKGIRIEKLKPITTNEFQWQHFGSVADIKAFNYKGTEVGFSVLSVFITKTRNPRPLISPFLLESVNSLMQEATYLVDAAERLIEMEKPDLIVFFNGRFFDTKPFYSLAVKHQINYVSSENIGGIRANDDYRIVTFFNGIPHDARVVYESILTGWNMSNRTIEDKIKIGSSFYEKRRNGVRAGDYSYTNYQEKGKLPVDYDAKKKYIIFFTSSEDEFSSVSSEVDHYYIFNSQYEAIKYIAENLEDDDYHIYVRIHPNMRGLKVEYHTDLYKLSNYKNVTVIAPEETISSYALIDIAYNITTFGSTIGAESMYWGKPLVLLGFAAYYYWGCCQVATKKEDVIKMLKCPIVFPNAKELSIKYGFYFLENGLAKKAEHIPITPIKGKIWGRDTYTFDYLRIGGSSYFFKIVRWVFLKYISKLYQNKIEVPVYKQ